MSAFVVVNVTHLYCNLYASQVRLPFGLSLLIHATYHMISTRTSLYFLFIVVPSLFRVYS